MVRYVDLISDTICAPVTAPGYASVAVIRVSGNRAWDITRNFVSRKDEKQKSHHAFLTSFKNQNDKELDQVLITYFEKGRSFSGDETVEVACHGNPLIVNAICEVYLNNGCRMAEPGEFSFRAFYNGRIDLVQAESIQQLVRHNNQRASSVSLDHLNGSLSRKFETLEKRIITILSHLEVQIDFVEQDVNPDENAKLIGSVKESLKLTNQLLLSYESGKKIRQGHKILILGPTNVGKSSLFNRLFNEEKVIVTNQEGTTRDLIGKQTFFGSHFVELFDSAGIRESQDPVEKIGIKKSLEAIKNSCLIVCVIDKTKDVGRDFFKKLPLNQCFVVFNKIDLFSEKTPELFDGSSPSVDLERILSQIMSINSKLKKDRIFFVSALNGFGLENLKKNIESFIGSQTLSGEQSMVTQARHFNHLSKLQESLKKTMEFLQQGQSPDLVSQELSMGLNHIHQILGKEYNDEVLNNIFSEFCIGK